MIEIFINQAKGMTTLEIVLTSDEAGMVSVMGRRRIGK